MGKTYSCDVEGCDKVFSRDYKLRKHKITHEDPNRLSYCEWPECDFYTLEPRNLGIHYAVHTGEKNRSCPDTNKILGPSGSFNREERCNYITHDPALLTKHRKKKHGYIPHERAPSNDTGNFEFVFENIPSSHDDTSSTTSRARKQKRARKPKAAVQRAKSTRTRAAGKVKDPGHAKDTAPDCSLPSTSQQGVDEYQRVNVKLSDAIAPSPAGLTNTASATPGRTSSDDNTFVAPNSLADARSPHATAYDSGSTSSTAQVPNQGDLFDHATNFDWSRYYMGSTSQLATGMYNPEPYCPAPYYPAPHYPAPNPEMNVYAMGSLGMYFGQDNSLGFGAWDESQAGYNL